jgi:hypothetical protein
LPQALLYPQLVASVGSLPLTELLGHLPPRGSRPRNPQDAAQDGAVLVEWSACPTPLRWQEGADQRPLLVGEVRLFERDRRALGRPFSAYGVPSRAFCGPAAGRHGLVRPPPQRPSQEETSSSLRLDHRQYQPPDLRDGRRDQARVEIPFLRLPSSSTAAQRVTAKKAWASRQMVMWRCQASHLLTS